ncbi:uncharacterized protein KGF55_002860 [Candida pseudojiufengensis]|uniref:uncharacterized protein n=1 Tax=Candida pseudojiufengensis TaxID=497109 RepID=UPI0022241C8E|nr:uncharacterized protein KGF55_002860 [Candida pseudojiufengensis]KAI5963068.1 hypothetical protein KGF55_002860 [Candida pseudojiufengensis]
MPEVSEVAHVCALLKRNVIGFKISNVNLQLDKLLFPILKESTNPELELEKMRNIFINSEILSTGRHGKYFWLRLLRDGDSEDKSNVLLMHFGMTGMIKIRNVKSHLVFMENGGDKKFKESLEEKNISNEIKVELDTNWPPKFTKFEMELIKGNNKLELAFCDPRRLGRIRLISDPKATTDEGLLTLPPLNVLGPDYSKSAEFVKPEKEFVFGDPDPSNHGRPRLGIAEFNKLILSRKKPLKSLLLDQQLFAGVGNWVGDEITFHAKLHPEEVISSKIENNLDVIHPIVQKLYDSIIYVCEESVKCEGNAKQFPKHWLMLHRWGKARKKQGKSQTKEGYILDHITVGGRTSCYAPEVQRLLKKEFEDENVELKAKPKANSKKVIKEDSKGEVKQEIIRTSKRKNADEELELKETKLIKPVKKVKKEVDPPKVESNGRRRSARIKAKK